MRTSLAGAVTLDATRPPALVLDQVLAAQADSP
jgi:hypothetical protein